MEFDIGVLIAIYVVAFVSVIGSVFVIISIAKFGHSCTSTQLVLYLHIGQIIQDIAALPKIFNRSPIACRIAGWLHCYSGMSNIIVVVTMVVTYRHMFFEDRFKISGYLQKHSVYHAFVAPLITLFPFINDAYGSIEDSYCSIKPSGQTMTIIWVYLTLVWCVAVACVGMLILMYTTVSVYMKDVEMGTKVLKSIGLYAVTTLLFWIPRLFFEIASYNYNDLNAHQNVMTAIAFVLVYFAGGIYTFLFMREKEAMKLFETTNKLNNALLNPNNDDSSSGGQGLVYSWEFEEEFDEKLAMRQSIGMEEDQKMMLSNPIVSVHDASEFDIK